MTQEAVASRPASPSPAEIFACLGIGLLVMVPELVSGTSYSDSFRYNIVWSEAFAAAIQRGELLPRWLPDSWDGMGSPAFYFYPPLFFVTAGLIAWAGVGLLTTAAATSLASALFIGLSGVTMRLWLAEQVPLRVARVCALLWMVAPYRLIDIYARGALAEATIYASLPLLMWGVARLGRGAGGAALPAVAAGYGLMLIGHLPVTLLATLTVIPAFALTRMWGSREERGARLALAMGGGLAGVGLAAFFLLPALTLLDHVSADQLFTPFFLPDNWLFLHGPNSLFQPSVSEGQAAGFLLSLGQAMLGVLCLLRFRTVAGVALWSLLLVLFFLLLAGAAPGVWDLPLVRQVQFPSRLLVLAEFAALTLLALVWGRFRPLLLVLPALPLALGSMLAVRMAAERVAIAAERGAFDRDVIRKDWREAPEYLPAGYPIAFDEKGRANPATIVLPPRGEVVTMADKATVSAVRRTGTGGLAFTVRVSEPARLEIRRFWFPGWTARIEGGQSLTPGPSPSGLAALTVPAGTHVVRVERGRAPLERAAMLISLATVLLLLAASRYFLRRRTRLTAF